MILAAGVPLIQKLPFNTSLMESFTNMSFAFVWPYLAIGIALWIIGILIAMVMRLFNGYFFKADEEQQPDGRPQKNIFLYFITGNDEYLGEGDEPEYVYHEPGFLEDLMVLFTGRISNRWYEKNHIGFVSGEQASWIKTITYLFTGTGRDVKDYFARDEASLRNYNSIMYILTGRRKYLGRQKPKPIKPSFLMYIITGKRKYLRKQKSKHVKKNLLMYMLTGKGGYLGEQKEKKVKPSLFRFYLTRNKKYLGRGGLKPSFWPDVISEGFYLVYGGLFGFGGGKRARRNARPKRHRRFAGSREYSEQNAKRINRAVKQGGEN